MRFEYRVRDHNGQLQEGTTEAGHIEAVAAGLLAQGYYIISLRELERKKNNYSSSRSILVNRIKTRDLIIFTRQLSAMLAAGLPILRCLKILWQQSPTANFKKVILSVKAEIEAGHALWEAMAQHPQIFPGVYISMLRAGEAGGVLDDVLDSLCSYLEREEEIKSKVKAVSLYPLVISILAVVVVIFIITWVMPRFSAIFQSAGVQLPGATRLLISTGAYVQSAGLYSLLGVALSAYVVHRWVATTQGKLAYDNVILHLPMLGKTIRKIAVARFARTLAILIKAGIPILQALEVTKETVDNAIISRAIARACSRIKEGETITAPFEEAGLFEPMVIHMMAVGEETGRLEEMLRHMTIHYERELMHAVDYLMAMIEPALILLVAILIGGVVVATLMPIFEMMNLVGI